MSESGLSDSAVSDSVSPKSRAGAAKTVSWLVAMAFRSGNEGATVVSFDNDSGTETGRVEAIRSSVTRSIPAGIELNSETRLVHLSLRAGGRADDSMSGELSM